MFKRKKNSQNERVRQTRIPVQRADNKEFFSYHANRSSVTDQSSRSSRQTAQVESQKSSLMQHLPLLFAVVCLALSAFYLTTLQSDIVLKSGKKNTLLQEEKVYREASQNYLNSSILHKNKLGLDTKKFSLYLKEKFPELSEVSITLPLLGQKPIVELNAVNPVLLIASQQGTYALSDNGVAIAQSSREQPIDGLTIPVVRDEANITVELGKGVLTSQDVDFITTLIKQFEAKKIPIESLTLPPLAAELHVRTVNTPYYIKFNLLTDPRIVTGQYFATLKKFTTDGIAPKEYVDSRVEEKVFFK